MKLLTFLSVFCAIIYRLFMDNFKSKESGPRSIDGFVPIKRNGKKAPQPEGLHGFNQYYKPAKGGKPDTKGPGLDSFRSLDGFVPSENQVIQNPASNMKANEFSSEVREERIQEFTRTVKKEKAEKTKKKRHLLRRKKDKVKGEKKSKKRLGLKLTGAFAGILLLIGGGLALRAFLISRNIFKGGGNSSILNNQNVDPSQLKGEGDGRVNILLLGKGGEGHDGADLTDTIIVASIDPIAKEAALLSIPRDFWVKSATGYQSKINEVYYNAKTASLNKQPYAQRDSNDAKQQAEEAGLDAIEEVVSRTMGVPIHYNFMIDFKGFQKAIDTVGGVDINVTKDMAVYEKMRINNKTYYLNVKEGQQHFDGLRALAFSRSRHTSSRGDFARADRQRAVILALKDKILSLGTLANPVKINSLMGDLGGNMSTSFSVNELLRLYDLSKEIGGDKVVSVGLDDFVGGSTSSNGLSIQIPKAGMFVYDDIQDYVRNIMRDAFLKQEDAKVVVLNGTKTPGLATKKAKELKSYGYNVTDIDDAPTDTYTTTVIVDMRNGANKYTLNYLEKRFGVTGVRNLPDSNIVAGEADFVIILGTDTVD